LGECALSMVGVEEGREFRFRGDLYSQESTLPLLIPAKAFARDYVITGVGLSVCLFVCLFVTTITK